MSEVKRKVGERRDYMTSDQRTKMGDGKRTHQYCQDKTSVARPGKTAHDRAKKGQ